MKQCPQCGREYDPSMMFCLDDGAELLYGPAPKAGALESGSPADGPQTAILHDTSGQSEAAARAQMYTIDRTAVLPSGIANEFLATFYAEMGEKDKAFAMLDEVIETMDQHTSQMKVDPFMDPLRNDPRFKEVLRRTGFPE